jgi:hypothetical protein
MSLDERMTQIAERHLALAETVQIIAGMIRDSERRIEDLER